MRSARTSCGGLPPCQGCRKPSCNGWGWVLIYTGSLKFRIWRVDRANGERWGEWGAKCDGMCKFAHVALWCFGRKRQGKVGFYVSVNLCVRKHVRITVAVGLGGGFSVLCVRLV